MKEDLRNFRSCSAITLWSFLSAKKKATLFLLVRPSTLYVSTQSCGFNLSTKAENKKTRHAAQPHQVRRTTNKQVESVEPIPDITHWTQILACQILRSVMISETKCPMKLVSLK